ncbi:MAG: S24 family peptidase [Candidatus Cloacimonadaceae bacterium]|nr:S24 family peptidase [Candidatus Cloacimonadaceae bacterium]
MSKKTTGDRLAYLIKTLAVKDYEFAEKYKISRASLIRYKQNERYPEPEFLLALSQDKINLIWLLTGNGSMYVKDEFEEFIKHSQQTTEIELNQPKQTKVVKVAKPIHNTYQELDIEATTRTVNLPIVGDIAAGSPLEIPDQYGMSGEIELPKSYIPGNPRNYIVFQVNGRSMEPIIQHADIVIIKANPIWELADNQVAAVRTSDGVTLKKVQIDHQREQVILQPFNLDFPVLVLDSNWNSDASLIGTIALQLRLY